VVDRSDDASCLLGLAGLAVERVVLTGLGVKIVQLVTDDPDAARCPSCRVRSTSGKDWVLTRPRDLACGGEYARMQWRKRRWRCRTLDCPRKTFTEQVAQVPAGMRTTTRLRTALAVAVEDGRDQSEVAAAHRVSWPTVQRAVIARGAVELVEPDTYTASPRRRRRSSEDEALAVVIRRSSSSRGRARDIPRRAVDGNWPARWVGGRGSEHSGHRQPADVGDPPASDRRSVDECTSRCRCYRPGAASGPTGEHTRTHR
jgi:hypothetical protein